MAFRELRYRLNEWFVVTTGKGAETVGYETSGSRLVVTAQGLLTEFEHSLLSAYPQDHKIASALMQIREELARRCSPGWKEFVETIFPGGAELEAVAVDLRADQTRWTFVELRRAAHS